MSDQQEEKNWQESWKERLKTNYRFVVMHNETFEEVNTFQSSIGRMLSLGVLAMFFVSLLTALLFLFTPIKSFLGNVLESSGSKTLRLEDKIDELESKIQAQEVWQNNVRKVLVGQPDTMGTGHQANTTEESPSDTVEVARIPQDEALRQELDSTRIDPTAMTDINLPSSEVPLGQKFFTPPLTGELSKTFDPVTKHFGVDVIAPKNTAIKSSLDGFVISADWTLETGNTICVQHKGDVITFYKHNSALLKKVGDTVKAGEAIAIIGDTGDHSTGPHLHFEIWHKGTPVDPGDYVNFN